MRRLIFALLLLPSLALGAVQCPLHCEDPEHASRSGEPGWTTVLAYSQHPDGYTCPDPPRSMGLCRACAAHVVPPEVPPESQVLAQTQTLLRLQQLEAQVAAQQRSWWWRWGCACAAALTAICLLLYAGFGPLPRRWRR